MNGCILALKTSPVRLTYFLRFGFPSRPPGTNLSHLGTSLSPGLSCSLAQHHQTMMFKPQKKKSWGTLMQSDAKKWVRMLIPALLFAEVMRRVPWPPEKKERRNIRPAATAGRGCKWPRPPARPPKSKSSRPIDRLRAESANAKLESQKSHLRL